MQSSDKYNCELLSSQIIAKIAMSSSLSKNIVHCVKEYLLETEVIYVLIILLFSNSREIIFDLRREKSNHFSN
jgi:hypothetical protein